MMITTMMMMKRMARTMCKGPRTCNSQGDEDSNDDDDVEEEEDDDDDDDAEEEVDDGDDKDGSPAAVCSPGEVGPLPGRMLKARCTWTFGVIIVVVINCHHHHHHHHHPHGHCHQGQRLDAPECSVLSSWLSSISSLSSSPW